METPLEPEEERPQGARERKRKKKPALGCLAYFHFSETLGSKGNDMD